MRAKAVLAEMRSMADPEAVKGMARFGITTSKALGISIPTLRKLARRLGKDHRLAGELWKSGIHEARILAAMVDDPELVTEEQMEEWVGQFDSWDVCDGCCGELFDKTNYAYAKALEWSGRREEYVRRAGYVLMAELAVHDKKAPDEAFIGFFDPIERGSTDPRNFVKKSVNWAIRQIGKRDLRLNRQAVALATRISKFDSGSAKWVGSDALRELKSEAVRKRIRRSS